MYKEIYSRICTSTSLLLFVYHYFHIVSTITYLIHITYLSLSLPGVLDCLILYIGIKPSNQQLNICIHNSTCKSCTKFHKRHINHLINSSILHEQNFKIMYKLCIGRNKLIQHKLYCPNQLNSVLNS